MKATTVRDKVGVHVAGPPLRSLAARCAAVRSTGRATTAVATTTAMGRESTIGAKVRWAIGDDAYTLPIMLRRTKRLAFTALTATDTALLARAGGAPPAEAVVHTIERLQRAADANDDSDNVSAGPLAGHSVAGRSRRVAMTRGQARQPRTGGETVVLSSTPPMSREEYVAALLRAADACKILEPRVGRLQAAVDVAAERSLSNQAAHRQDRDDKVAGAP